LGQTNFTVNYTPGLLDVFYNGAKLDNTEYTAANGTSITLATGSNAGDTLEVDVYSYQVGAFSGIGGVGVANQIAYYNTSNSITGSNAFTVSGSAIIITGSLIVSGSGTLINIGPAVFSGSVTAVGGFSGSFSGNADSASLAQNSLLLQGTGSVGFTTTSSFLAVSSSQQQISASQQQLSSSFLALTASFNAVSASQQQISASLLNVISIFATTGSNSFRATQSITGSLTVTGQIVAQSINVQQVTSSIIYSSGSNVFGCDLNSRQTFTGSVLITGSLTIAGASSATSYSGTTIYGSTAVCSPVGKFTSCIDAGSGIFSSSVTATQGFFTATANTYAGGALKLTSFTGGTNIYLTSVAGIFALSNGGSADHLTITSTGTSTFNSTDLNTIFVTNPTTTGATIGSGIGFKAYNGTSVDQSAGIILTSNTWSYGTYSANQLSIGADGTGGIALRTACSAPISFFTGCTTAGLSAERMRLCSNGFAYFACELTAKTLGTNDLLLNNLNYECANYVDGTRGSWLIQEGACDLFIINQMSCKKYKFNLIEIK
jgi:hypothetical protein